MRLAAMLTAIFLALAAAAAAGLPPQDQSPKMAVLWIELGANLPTLVEPAKLASMMERVKQAGFTAVAVEAKNAAGFAAYPSKFAPHISQSAAPRQSLFNPYDAPNTWVPSDLDILQQVIEAASARGIAVWAAVNVFSEGINLWDDGAAYLTGFNRDWLATVWAPSRKIVARDGAEIPIAAVNIGRTIFGITIGRIPDQTVLYSTDPPPISKWATGWAQDGVEVVIAADKDENLFVKDIVDWQALAGKPYNLRIPGGGFILSMHGAAKRAALQHLKIGEPIALTKLEKRLAKSTETGIFAFTNPMNPEVQSRILRIIREIASNYRVEGIVLDRIRYGGSNMDFSDWTRSAFEAYAGGSISRWPESVLDWGSTPSWYVSIPGRYFPRWAAFRAQVIKSFIEKARSAVKSENPDMQLAAYVGAWYPNYYEEATNWASSRFKPNYWWTTADWQTAGAAELLDQLFIGLYFRNVTIRQARSRPVSDADWASIEGAIPLIRSAVMNSTMMIGGINLTDYEDKPQEISHALNAIKRGMQNLMVFDLVYLDAWNLWPEVAKTLSYP